jgi:hypothetical protein
MKSARWRLAVVSHLCEQHFCHEMLKEALYSVIGSSSGIGITLTTAVLGIGHRVLCTACEVTSMQSPEESHELRQHISLANTNA